MIADILKEKNVLLICPEFHHYNNSIINAMTGAGAQVYYIPTIEEKLNDLFKVKSLKVIGDYYHEQLKKYHNYDITLLFQIRGENIDPELYAPFIQKGTRLVMYQWDSIENHDYTGLLPYFNKAFSFDRVDCEKYSSLRYLSNFHEIKPVKQEEEIYDLFNVAGFAYWRYKLINNFYALSKKNSLTTFIRLKLPLKTYLKFYATGHYTNPRLLTIKGVNKADYIKKLSQSKVVIDTPSPTQNGLTMRTIEALAANKKLITTNKQIEQEPFYSPNKILILDSNFDEAQIMAFIKNDKTEDVDMSGLYITNWILKILS
jgi:hypothetical protein